MTLRAFRSWASESSRARSARVQRSSTAPTASDASRTRRVTPRDPVPLLFEGGDHVFQRSLRKQDSELSSHRDLRQPHLHLDEGHRAYILRDIQRLHHAVLLLFSRMRDSRKPIPVRRRVSANRSFGLPSSWKNSRTARMAATTSSGLRRTPRILLPRTGILPNLPPA